MSLTEVMRLQNELSQLLARRFRQELALTFTDVVGATPYFQRFGDEAGRRLLQRNQDAVERVLDGNGGRIVDTAGDGVFCTFPAPANAALALIALQKSIAEENLAFEDEHRLVVRAGLHFGPVLSDGTTVAGDAVNLAARVAGTVDGPEVRLTRPVHDRLPFSLRKRCTLVGSETLKGVADPVELLRLECRDLESFASIVTVNETKEVISLPPDLERIRFGRLKAEANGETANEVVLLLPDPNVHRRISRRHFELHRAWSGFRLRSLTSQKTEVDGHEVQLGEEVDLRPDSTVRLSGVATLVFERAAPLAQDFDRTLHPPVEAEEGSDETVRATADSIPPLSQLRKR